MDAWLEYRFATRMQAQGHRRRKPRDSATIMQFTVPDGPPAARSLSSLRPAHREMTHHGRCHHNFCTGHLITGAANVRAPVSSDHFGVRGERCVSWTANLRALSSLRDRSGDDQTGAVVVHRHVPGRDTFTLASTPIPRATNCTLCFAEEIGHIALPDPGVPLDLIATSLTPMPRRRASFRPAAMPRDNRVQQTYSNSRLTYRTRTRVH